MQHSNITDLPIGNRLDSRERSRRQPKKMATGLTQYLFTTCQINQYVPTHKQPAKYCTQQRWHSILKVTAVCIRYTVVWWPKISNITMVASEQITLLNYSVS